MLSYDRNRRAGVATCVLLQQIIATVHLCCNNLLHETVATHFTMNDATHLDGSYHVLLQQTYAPGCLKRDEDEQAYI